MVLGLLTLAPLEFTSLKVDSSKYMPYLHCFSFQCLNFLQKASLVFTIFSISIGFFGANCMVG
jgi:hypothetical protein